MKRGRPKSRSRDNRSFGPLGDLVRKQRLAKGLGLADIAKACQCSVQFISNIEHGRAPLPWEKATQLANVLKVPVEDLQIANLAIRSDFKSFVNLSKGGAKATKSLVGQSLTGTASAVAFASRDHHLQDVIQKYQNASLNSRKKLARAAIELLPQ